MHFPENNYCENQSANKCIQTTLCLQNGKNLVRTLSDTTRHQQQAWTTVEVEHEAALALLQSTTKEPKTVELTSNIPLATETTTTAGAH
jgi:hypothetical protein